MFSYLSDVRPVRLLTQKLPLRRMDQPPYLVNSIDNGLGTKSIIQQGRFNIAFDCELRVDNGYHTSQVVIPPQIEERVPPIKDAPSRFIREQKQSLRLNYRLGRS